MGFEGHGGSLAAGVLATLALLASATQAMAQLSSDPMLLDTAPVDSKRPLAQELNSSASPTLSVTVAGSMLLDSPDGAPPPFDPAVRQVLHAGDRAGAPNVTVGTLQTPIIDPRATKASPFPWNAAPVIRAAPALADSLRTQGVDAVMLATGHALDWGIEGMRATGEALDAANLVRAGTGETASKAGHAAYYDQPGGGGRIAFVSTATTFRPTSNALDQKGAAPGRPGVHGIELAAIRRVTQAQFHELQKIACRFQYRDPAQRAGCDKPSPAATVTALGSTFRAGSGAAEYGTTEYQLNVPQADAFLSNIREGKENADLLVAGIHTDQVEDARYGAVSAPAFLTSLAHAAIESGADLVVATGRPVLGPIEIYTAPGKPPRPIFYGLGDFARSAGLAPPAQDFTQDGAIVRSVLSKTTLTVEIIPLDLGPDGWPRIAANNRATEILNRVRAQSARYGTNILVVANGGTAVGRIIVPIPPVAREKKR